MIFYDKLVDTIHNEICHSEICERHQVCETCPYQEIVELLDAREVAWVKDLAYHLKHFIEHSTKENYSVDIDREALAAIVKLFEEWEKEKDTVKKEKDAVVEGFSLESFENKIQKRAKDYSLWSDAGEYERGYEKGLHAAFKEVLWLIEEEKK